MHIMAGNMGVILVSGICIPQANAATNKERPNIVCIVCEDIGPYLGCYGDKVAKTPNLDKFAGDAVLYSNMFTSIGVSAPSRFSLITGLYPSCYGANQMRCTSPGTVGDVVLPYSVVLPEGVRCYTEFLREKGYYCTNNAKTDYQFNAPLTAWDENSSEAHWRNRPEGCPFFAIFNISLTHESQIWRRSKKPLVVSPDSVSVPPYYPDDPVIRKDIAVMYSNIYAMDSKVSTIINELKEDGLYDDTIIIWYSDNGGPLPRQKREVYESGMKVPFMIKYEHGRNAGTTDSQLAAFVDIPATILSLAGIRPPEYMQGRAFAGKYRSDIQRRYVYGMHDRMDEQIDKIGAIRDSRYRYIRNYIPEKSGYMPIAFRLQMPMMRRMVELYEKDSLDYIQKRWFEPRPEEEFYDVSEDPHEINNLIGNPEYKDEIQRLRSEYEKWIRKYNKDWFLSEREQVEKMWPGGIQPEVSSPVFRKTRKGIIISCRTPGASIAYRVTGPECGKDGRWLLYSGPVVLNDNERISAVGVRIGYRDSRCSTYEN